MLDCRLGSMECWVSGGICCACHLCRSRDMLSDPVLLGASFREVLEQVLSAAPCHLATGRDDRTRIFGPSVIHAHHTCPAVEDSQVRAAPDFS